VRRPEMGKSRRDVKPGLRFFDSPIT
jgi:hypothetical protein